MNVSDVVITALHFVGRSDLAELIEGGQAGEEAEQRAIGVMLHCFNAAEDELAMAYFPLHAEEQHTPSSGRIYYTLFSHNPVKILSVTRGGRAVEYRICPEYLEVTGGAVTVKYVYCPKKKKLTDESDFSGYPVGARMLAYGAASEYCIIDGAYEEAEKWEERYKYEIERFRPYKKGTPIAAREWI